MLKFLVHSICLSIVLLNSGMGTALAQNAAESKTAQQNAASTDSNSAQKGKIEKFPLIGMEPWMKVCGKDKKSRELCFVSREFGAEKDHRQILSIAVYDYPKEHHRYLRILTPPDVLISPGVRFSLDDGALRRGTFETCFPKDCFAEAELSPASVPEMLKSKYLNVGMLFRGNRLRGFVLPLDGFEQALNGPSQDLSQFEQHLQDERQRLQNESKP